MDTKELRAKAEPVAWHYFHHAVGSLFRAKQISSIGKRDLTETALYSEADYLSLLDERDRLAAENERMRKALEEIRDRNQDREWKGEDGSYGTEGWVTRDGQYAKIARAAIKEQSHD